MDIRESHPCSLSCTGAQQSYTRQHQSQSIRKTGNTIAAFWLLILSIAHRLGGMDCDALSTFRRHNTILRKKTPSCATTKAIFQQPPLPVREEEETSDSLGSLLMRMKNSEEALLLQSNQPTGSNVSSLAENSQVRVESLDDPIHKVKSRDSLSKDATMTLSENEVQQVPFEATIVKGSTDWSGIDFETAKELDDSVTPLILSDESLPSDMKVLPLSSLYASLRNTEKLSTPSLILPLSRPEHYRDRIGRDRRHLAASIAATTETETQWRLFCQEQGGLYPILETVREGARVLTSGSQMSNRNHPQQSSTSGNLLDTAWQEEDFRAACTACRALRDLCAISPELAAVLTDGMLRANANWKGGLFLDFCIILKQSHAAPTDGNPRMVPRFRKRKDTRLRCKLYVSQLLLAMAVASDYAVTAIRETPGLSEAVLECSSYAQKEQARRWLRYPGEMVKWLWRQSRGMERAEPLRRPFMEAAKLANDLNGEVQRSSNQILAAIGHNKWIPKNPGQRGLRILSLDGGGSRGMAAITAVHELMESVGNGSDVADSFDMIVGTSTGGIIAFLIGLQRETSAEALERYKLLIKQIFVKSALSTPMMLFTTASYDEVYFMDVLVKILKENSMLDSRADPTVPLVCALTSKMSSTPTHVALFRNYNYAGGELPDPFTLDPTKARSDLNLPLELEHQNIRRNEYLGKVVEKIGAGKKLVGSRHPGSFRVLQRYALRASTAAPTFFKPVMMAGEMYCDGGIVASNPAAVAIHEARSLFPDIPIELVVSVGTGAFVERKSAPRVGWDGIIGQIVNSATDGEQIHHILEDLLGEPALIGNQHSAVARTRYFRFNPVIGLPDEFPIDVTDPAKLNKLMQITQEYMGRPEQQEKVQRIADILKGRRDRKRKKIANIFRRKRLM